MKIDRLETHDRLVQLHKKQAINLNKGADDCLKKNRLSIGLQQYSPYIYLFAHPRTADDGITKKMFWQPRLTKPQAQTNSYLFRAISNTDRMEICWLLPPKETWNQYKKGNVTEHEFVNWSIQQFLTNKTQLEASFEDDLNDEVVKNIYRRVSSDIDEENLIQRLY